MAITIDGAGTITGIASGGLNDNIITDDELNLAANASNVKTALNASGTAPIYACRAWVNFNGEGTVAIRASGNVTGITDNGTGDYTVNFTTALSDADYVVVSTAANTENNFSSRAASPARGVTGIQIHGEVPPTTNNCRLEALIGSTGTIDGGHLNSSLISVAIFR